MDFKKNYANKKLISGLKISAFTAFVAVFIGVVLTPFKLIEFINLYSNTPIINYSGMFNSLLDFSVKNISFSILIMLIVAAFSGTILKLLNEQKINSKDFTKRKTYFNKISLFTFLFLLISYALKQIFVFVLSGILFAVHLWLSNIGYSPSPLNYAIAILLVTAIYLAFIAAIVVLIYLLIYLKDKNKINFKKIINFFNTNKFEMQKLFILLASINAITVPVISFAFNTKAYKLVKIIMVFVVISYYVYLLLFNKKLREKLVGKNPIKTKKENYGKDRTRKSKTKNTSRTKKN